MEKEKFVGISKVGENGKRQLLAMLKELVQIEISYLKKL